jgi:streptomycin 6-kinase
MESRPDPHLKERIHDCIRDWAVEVGGGAETETSVLLFGHRGDQPVVHKVLRKPGDEWHSGEVVAAFDGHGMVRVLEHAEGALLLERLRPGTLLVQLSLAGQDDHAIDILAGVIGAMAPRAAPASTPTAFDWAAGFDRYAPSGDTRIPGIFCSRRARSISGFVTRSPGPGFFMVTCSTTTSSSMKSAGGSRLTPRASWPSRSMKCGAALRNPYERFEPFAETRIIERRIERVTTRLGLDPGRVLSWGFAQGVLSAAWSVEDGQPLDPNNPGLLLAQAIRSMPGALG